MNLHQIFIGEQPVYDYKVSDGKLVLITGEHDLYPGEEILTWPEVEEGCKEELDLSTCTILHEDTGKELKIVNETQEQIKLESCN